MSQYGKPTDFNFGYNDPEAPAFSECMARIECKTCRKFHGYCAEIQNFSTYKQEATEMDLSKHYSGGSDGKNGKSSERRDFLKAKDLPRKGALTVKVDDVREAPKSMQYSDILIDVSNGPKFKRTWGLRKGFTLDAIIDKFGKNSDKWRGKKISVEKGGDKGQFINVVRT